MTDFNKLFFPRAVGIIGVNEKHYGGGYFLRCLLSTKFEKPIYIFNPRLKDKNLEGIKVLGSISDLNDHQTIDYVILAVPAQHCANILEEVGLKKVPYVTIFTSGFSEVNKEDLEKDVLKVAQKYNIRIIGPNCLGVYNPKSRLSFSRLHVNEAGNLGLISQSGGLSIYMSNMAIYSYGTYISKLISIGNQIDLNVVDFLKYFYDDDDTKIIGIYLENIKSKKIGKEFIEIVKNLSLEKEKPVILWKVGFGDSTKEAILSHTGGIAGSTKIWKAIAQQTGGILVHDSFELITLAMTFNYINFHQVDRNLGIVAVGGGSSIELTEYMEMYNLKVPKLNDNTKKELLKFLPDVNTIIRNPLDLGGSGIDTEVFYKSLITLDKDPNVSIVIFIPYYYNDLFLNCIIKAKSEMNKPLVCIAHNIMDHLEDYNSKLKFKKELFKTRVPIFESIELTAKAIDKMCTFKEFIDKRKD
jgi:acetyltransferase